MSQSDQSTSQVVHLLTTWGFTEKGFRNNAIVLSKDGRELEVSLTAPRKNQKTLRRASRIIGVSVKEILAGPKRTEQPTEEPMATVDTEVEEYACDTCGRTFKTTQGLKAHGLKHQTRRCNSCGKTFSVSGYGRHAAACGPKKRGRGRPRHPIAEAVELPGKRRAMKGKDLEVEVPILDDMDDSFPTVEAFGLPVEDIPRPQGLEATTPEDRMDAWRTLVQESDLDVRLGYSEDFTWREVTTLLRVFFPGRTLDDTETEAFLGWVRSTRDTFDLF